MHCMCRLLEVFIVICRSNTQPFQSKACIYHGVKVLNAAESRPQASPLRKRALPESSEHLLRSLSFNLKRKILQDVLSQGNYDISKCHSDALRASVQACQWTCEQIRKPRCIGRYDEQGEDRSTESQKHKWSLREPEVFLSLGVLSLRSAHLRISQLS